MAATEQLASLGDIVWTTPILAPHHDLQLEARIKKKHGAIPGAAPYVERLPWLAEVMFLVDIRLAEIPVDLKGLVELVVSQDNSCRYCYGITRFVLKALGYSEMRISELERDLYLSEMNARDRLALDFVRKISRSNPRPDRGEVQSLYDAGYSRLAVAELAFLAAFNCMTNRVATMLALPPEAMEQMDRKWLFPLLRPLVKRKIRAASTGGPTSLPENLQGPCAPLVRMLEGSPCAQVLCEIIDSALSSQVIPLRAKALAIAVVARTIGCDRLGALTQEMLEKEGLTPESVERVLAHLSAPDLTPLESDLLPLARETVRYRNDAIQKRMRAFARAHGPEVTLEAIGITSIANCMTRLGILLECH